MKTEIVVLLHGLGRTYRSMKSIEKALIKEKYRVFNIDYPSRKKNISALVETVYNQIQFFINQDDVKIHFVTHSMGGILTRELLAQYPIHNLGYIVMLGPPNQGSELAEFLKNKPLFKQFYGPALSQLAKAAAHKLPQLHPTVKVGVIAGTRALVPIFDFVLPGLNDGIVTVESTKLKTMLDFFVMPATHSLMMYNKKVIEQAIYFLKNGRFDR